MSHAGWSSRVAANALYQSLGFTRRETNVYEFLFERRKATKPAR